jgi:hypothetical protein
MGARARKLRQETQRAIRCTPLSKTERDCLARATYEGSPQHKRHPGDFGLTPPAAPRPDKTLCDEALIFRRAEARRLLRRGIARGLVSEVTSTGGFPKQIWVVDENGNVFEAMHGGSTGSAYHRLPHPP